MRGGLRIYVQGRSLAFSKDVVCRLRLTEEIVSRKYTQFSEIQIETGMSYIRELKDKYPQGAIIADVPSNRAGGANACLEGYINTGITGTQILEVPVQINPIPQRLLDEASMFDIKIRDINGKTYNP